MYLYLYPWTPKPWKMKVLNPQYLDYNPYKWRFWVPMVYICIPGTCWSSVLIIRPSFHKFIESLLNNAPLCKTRPFDKFGKFNKYIKSVHPSSYHPFHATPSPFPHHRKAFRQVLQHSWTAGEPSEVFWAGWVRMFPYQINKSKVKSLGDVRWFYFVGFYQHIKKKEGN